MCLLQKDAHDTKEVLALATPAETYGGRITKTNQYTAATIEVAVHCVRVNTVFSLKVLVTGH